MSTIFVLYMTLTTIGIIAMFIRAFRAFGHSPERLRTIVLLPALSCVIGLLYAYFLADKAFVGFVRLLRFGFLSDLLMYFVGMNILITALSVPAIPWLLSSQAARARIWGGVFCLCVAIWLPFCQGFTSAPPH